MQKLIVALSIALLFPSCGPTLSLNPLYTPKDLTFDSALLGNWNEGTSSGKNVLTFTQHDETTYELLYKEQKQVTRLQARLVKLKGHLFLDAVPWERPDNDFFIPVHIIFHLTRIDDTLKIAYLDAEWVAKMVKAKKIAIAHAEVDGSLVLTASTRDLQKFVIAHANNGRAFPDPGILYRQQ